jgi:Arc/MetJ family transcription regulator
MKTSLDIPDDELADVMRFTKAPTKREAIVTAIAEFNLIGTTELQALRRQA